MMQFERDTSLRATKITKRLINVNIEREKISRVPRVNVLFWTDEDR